MSSFFTAPASQRKRKRTDTGSTSTKRRQTSEAAPSKNASSRRRRSESISGSDSESIASEESVVSDTSSSSSIEGETAAERRLRLAERYLENVREEVDESGFDAAQIDRDLIAERLKEDVAEGKGKQYRYIADSYDFSRSARRYFGADQQSVTGVAAHTSVVYTVAKDLSVMKWDVPPQPQEKEVVDPPALPNGTSKNSNVTPRTRPRRIGFCKGHRAQRNNPKFKGHTGNIICSAISPSGKYLATGGIDKRLVIWQTEPLKPIKVFSQHRGAVISLAFRRGSSQLFSASADRTIKTWNIDDSSMAYVETLFGHQDAVTDVATLADETCATVGARDRTVRFWKVIEESQLVFRGAGAGSISKGNKLKASRDSQKALVVNGDGSQSDVTEKVEDFAEQSIDRVAMISSTHFITGASNGSMSLYSIHKKKPLFTLPLAHGLDPPPPPDESSVKQSTEHSRSHLKPSPRGITALRAIPYSDLVLSGSWDGLVRAWKVSTSAGTIEPVGVLGGSSPASRRNNPSSRLVSGQNTDGKDDQKDSSSQNALRGVVNDLAIVEKGDKGKEGLRVVVGLGKEHRLGRWRTWKCKHSSVLFDVGFKRDEGTVEDAVQAEVNGHEE